MPISKTFLPDVNILLALASRRHIHCEICSTWLASITNGLVILCRVSQMGLLRLLTSKSVMGTDVLTARSAWSLYTAMMADDRVSFAAEPFALEPEWKKLTNHDRPNTKVWTDAYLAAFAKAGGMRVVTLDRAFLSIDAGALVLS